MVSNSGKLPEKTDYVQILSINARLKQRLAARSKVGAYRNHHSASRNRKNTNQVAKNKLYLQVVDAGYDDYVGKALACPEYTGLSGMRERARLQGGQCEIFSTSETGTSVSAQLPLRSSMEIVQ